MNTALYNNDERFLGSLTDTSSETKSLVPNSTKQCREETFSDSLEVTESEMW